VNPSEEVALANAVAQLDVPSPNEDQLSVCLSVNSRKDSGIRSNSRRSSIQQQVVFHLSLPLVLVYTFVSLLLLLSSSSFPLLLSSSPFFYFPFIFIHLFLSSLIFPFFLVILRSTFIFSSCLTFTFFYFTFIILFYPPLLLNISLSVPFVICLSSMF
jgi:hypothetical protein